MGTRWGRRLAGRGSRSVIAAVLVLVLAATAAAGTSDTPERRSSATQERDGGTEPTKLDDASSELASQPADSAVALAASNMTYTAVDPCRAFDSRLFGPPFGGGDGYLVFLTDVCGVPFGATKAVMANVIAVNTTGTGYVRAFAWETGTSEATVVNFNNKLVSSNAIPLPVCDVDVAPEACADGDTVIYIPPATAKAQIVIDIVGFFSTGP
jgi:hypothetical protein